MNHADYKRALLADPRNVTPDMAAHAAGCPACSEYGARVLRFEERLDRALRIDAVADAPPRGVPLRPRRVPRTWLAMAASVLVAVIVAGGLWLAVPGPSLAAAVVAHMSGEPNAWVRTDVPVPEPKLAAVMRESRVRLKDSAGLVSYANSCGFRGHQVPHLVVQTGGGPVTVMVLTHEPMAKTVHFDEQGYRGMIVPVAGHGSLAVLEKGADADPDTLAKVVASVGASLEYGDGG